MKRFKSANRNRCQNNRNSFHSPGAQVAKARKPGMASSPGQIAGNVHQI